MAEPPKAATKMPPRSPSQELQDLSNLTFLLYRRNKNQHRRSHWWKHFNIFRRQLSSLCSKLPPSGKSPAATIPIKFGKQGRSVVDSWAQRYVAQWYASFSQIISESRFVGVALTILAIFARVCTLVGVSEKLADDALAIASTIPVNLTEPKDGDARDDGDDLGMVVERTAVSLHGKNVAEKPVSVEALEANTRAEDNKDTKSIKKKKKRTKSAIDDLFDF
ncbi:hypothetical protein BT63DRAFT_248361 [Microthyrium microscopicum]|uniref:RNase MRP protein 1 RNA binding domain-containing protein n=1 Tax=Microthyrium microscopicum TaxID=703497 RepID=A0A6A6UAN8_9PEZI|nr:hypothetical protein BT63DRAFT_248361 [Microthyrium microscopicum]